MATTIQVKLGERAYPIVVGRDLPVLSAIDVAKRGRVMLVSDATVDALHGALFHRRIEERGVECLRAVVPSGEETKSLKWVEFLYAKAAEAGLDRSCLIIALGGGVVGDLAGFVAATYLRGVGFAQIPTTLLAMVDSSVGGKTGINLPQGKNLVGAFYQPVAVDADLDLLQSLPQREYISGLAEVVKYGVIWDATLFGLLEKNAGDLVARRTDLLERVVARCCEIKAEVVAIDERESGPRAILNFGHTLGHALEKAAGYGEWLHGEAVAIGMRFAARLSVMTKKFPVAEAERIETLLQRLDLPLKPRCGRMPAWAEVRQAMLADKKTLRSRPRFVLAERLGAVVIGCDVEDDVLAEAWHVCCK